MQRAWEEECESAFKAKMKKQWGRLQRSCTLPSEELKSARTYPVKNYYPKTVDFMKGIAKDSLPCSANALKT